MADGAESGIPPADKRAIHDLIEKKRRGVSYMTLNGLAQLILLQVDRNASVEEVFKTTMTTITYIAATAAFLFAVDTTVIAVLRI